MLKSLRTSYLLPAELSETISRYLHAISESGLSDPFVTKLTELLSAGAETLSQALTAVRVNALIENVAEADAIRDDLFIGFKDLVNAGKRRRAEAFMQAYNAIWPVIEQAGTLLYLEGYAEQSGKLKALFAELDKPENRQHLTTLHADGIYAELKQAEADFISIYDDRLDEDAKKDYPTLSEAKRKTVPYVNRLIDAINILEEIEPGAHTALITKMNTITTAVESAALSRKTRSGEGSEA